MGRDAHRKRVTLSFRLRPEAAEIIRYFLRCHTGWPLFLEPGEFAEQALLREVQRRAQEAGVPIAPGKAEQPVIDLSPSPLPDTARRTAPLGSPSTNHKPRGR